MFCYTYTLFAVRTLYYCYTYTLFTPFNVSCRRNLRRPCLIRLNCGDVPGTQNSTFSIFEIFTSFSTHFIFQKRILSDRRVAAVRGRRATRETRQSNRWAKTKGKGKKTKTQQNPKVGEQQNFETRRKQNPEEGGQQDAEVGGQQNSKMREQQDVEVRGQRGLEMRGQQSHEMRRQQGHEMRGQHDHEEASKRDLRRGTP